MFQANGIREKDRVAGWFVTSCIMNYIVVIELKPKIVIHKSFSEILIIGRVFPSGLV